MKLRHWAGQLGDGRAINLGETGGAAGLAAFSAAIMQVEEQWAMPTTQAMICTRVDCLAICSSLLAVTNSRLHHKQESLRRVFDRSPVLSHFGTQETGFLTNPSQPSGSYVKKISSSR